MDISKVARSIFLAVSISVIAVMVPSALLQQAASAKAAPDPAVQGTRTTDGNWGANVRLAGAGINTNATPTLTLGAAGDVQASWIASPACGRAKGQTGTLMTAELAAGEWQAASVVSN